MGKQYTEIPQKLQDFIRQQPLFFVATATQNSLINLSPKGADAFRIIHPTKIAWLNLTGSGNETAAHLQTDSRMTIMFCAFNGAPLILRLYGRAKSVHKNDTDWQKLYELFPPNIGARQIFEMEITLVQSSCGMAVPLFQYQKPRDQLDRWALKKGEAGIQKYWREQNALSLNNIQTHITDKNL